MSLTSDTLSSFRANQSLYLLLIAVWLAEKQTNNNLIVFGLFEPTEHANYYTMASDPAFVYMHSMYSTCLGFLIVLFVMRTRF